MYLSKKERQYYDAQQKRYLDESSRIREEVEKGIEEGLKKAVQEAVQEAERVKQEALREAEKKAELAKQEAERAQKLSIAKNLITLGLDDSSIAQSTGLSFEQIEALRQDNKT